MYLDEYILYEIVEIPGRPENTDQQPPHRRHMAYKQLSESLWISGLSALNDSPIVVFFGSLICWPHLCGHFHTA